MIRTVAAFGFLLWAGAASAQTAQEQIERTIGGLVIQNATLTEQLRTANEMVAKLQKELAEARATPDAARPDSASPR